MTYQEAKQAFNKRVPVTYKNIKYKHINAIIFRRNEVEVIELELQDLKANSITIAKLEEVQCI